MSNILRSILLVERDPAAREEVAMGLRKNIDCVVVEAGTALEVLDILAQEDICVLIAGNLHTSDEQIDLLKNVHRKFSHVITIPCVPLGNQEAIVKALKMGCYTYHIGYEQQRADRRLDGDRRPFPGVPGQPSVG
jgi:DNA-binding NtrC family response regulator